MDQIDGTRALWLAVLRNGLIDAANGLDEAWVGSRGFYDVCRLAGCEPKDVEARFRSGRLADLDRAPTSAEFLRFDDPSKRKRGQPNGKNSHTRRAGRDRAMPGPARAVGA